MTVIPPDVPGSTAAPPPDAVARQTLRRRLLEARRNFAAAPSSHWPAAQDAVEGHLRAVLAELEPECLGVYWPVSCEFNAARPWPGPAAGAALPLALPFAQRTPVAMHYRCWSGAEPPGLHDECGIPSTGGATVDPDVLLVPCLGYTDEGFRLGYGGGYFDRYLAAHPHVTTVGVAWTVGRLAPADFQPEDHDFPLMLIVTEQGVVG